MNKDKQIEEKAIEEMAKVIERTEQIARDAHCGLPSPRMYAKDLYWRGYRKQSEWISVEERLPEDDLSEEHEKKTIKVLVAIKAKNGITIRTQERFRDYTYSNVGDPIIFWTWRFSRGKVTHWMPLPEPPTKKE